MRHNAGSTVMPRRRLITLFVVAVLFNYPWELAQSPLYQGMGSLNRMWWHCFLASLGDGLLVLLIFAAGRIAFHRQDWFAHPGIKGYALMLGAGLAISIGVEWIVVHVMKWWAYAPRMPLVPGLGIGTMPILQMVVLPPLIFRVVASYEDMSHARAMRDAETDALIC